jgi:hypothetical protein
MPLVRASTFAVLSASFMFGVATAVPPMSDARPATQSAGVSIPGWARFAAAHPGVRRLDRFDRAQRVYGVAMGEGADAISAATDFMNRSVFDIWGINPGQMLPIGPFADQSHIVPLMTDPITGQAAFTLVAWTPHVDGVPVFDAALRVLVRNEPGNPVVLASAQLPDVTGFRVPGGVVPTDLDPEKFAAVAIKRFAGAAEFAGVRPVVFAGVEGRSEPARLAVEFILGGVDHHGGPARVRFVADPTTGEIVHEENLILHADVALTVLTTIPTGIGAAICSPIEAIPLPNARVTVGAATYFADEFGRVTIPHPGTDALVIDATPRTRWFNVNDATGGQVTATITVPSGGSGTVTVNGSGATEQTQAQVNATYFAEEVRTFTLYRSFAYPTIGGQESFACNVNINSSCNAYYNGNSINFYLAGGGCNNTSFDTVVHHEYGHHLVNVAGSGQGEYGEGAGDVMGMLITGDPRLGVGFYSNTCTNGIRDADNTCQFSATGCSSCGSEIHSCGQLLSGLVWDMREGFLAAGLGTFRVESIFVNSIPLHGGTAIDEAVVIDWLALDDDDSSILNGTPHYAIIDAAARAHGLAAPELQVATFTFIGERPTVASPAGATPFVVRINVYEGTLLPGSQGIVHRIDGGDWIFTALDLVGGNRFGGVLPSAPCGTRIEWYLVLETTTGAVDYEPADGALDPWPADVATSASISFDDNGEADLGWTFENACSDGQWSRGVPIGGGDRGDPPTDYDGSGACWLTDNVDGNSDVDNGYTAMISPPIDASIPGTTVSYARWFYNCGSGSGTEVFVVDVSADGSNWVEVETVGPGGDETCGEWFTHEFLVDDFVAPTSTLRIRFTAHDSVGGGALIEAGVDAIKVASIDCVDPPSLLGDLNGDGMVDGTDVGLFLAQWGNAGGPADLNDDGLVDGADFGIQLGNWG